jgi:hypothetical protein
VADHDRHDAFEGTQLALGVVGAALGLLVYLKQRKPRAVAVPVAAAESGAGASSPPARSAPAPVRYYPGGSQFGPVELRPPRAGLSQLTTS